MYDRQLMQESLYEAADAGVSISQIADIGVSISGCGCMSLYRQLM